MEINKRLLLWVVIVVLFLAVLFLTYKASSVGKGVTGNVIDTSGWTDNEKMNYEMHGTIPARLQGKLGSSSISSGGMVGGC